MTRASFHVRVYRGLLVLYPRAFRSEYRDDLIGVFAELLLETGPLRTWRRVLVDLATTVPRQRLESIMKQPRSKTALFVASAAAIGSIAWMIWTVGELSEGLSESLRHWWSTLPVIALVASIVALVVLLRRPSAQRNR